jgi:L-rhamnose mutarotase
MVRRAFHITLTEGSSEAYREAHEDGPDEMEAVADDPDVGMTRYSIFEADGHVFGFQELADPEALAEASDEDVQAEWNEKMDPIFADVSDLEEVAHGP